MSQAQVAVLGLGHQSMEDHIPAILGSPDVRLVAVVDNDKKKLDDFKERHPEVHIYRDTEKLYAKEKPDFIIIALPHCCHFEETKKAIARGIHVLKEKPLAISLNQARELSWLANERGVHVMVTMQRRFNPIYTTFNQLADKIGHIYLINAKYSIYTDTPHTGWRGQKSLAGGGCLIDMGYHIIDLLMWYFGLPDKVISEFSFYAKENAQYDAEDTAVTLFEYTQKHCIGTLLISRVIPPKGETMDVFGTRGIIHLERGKIERRSTSGEAIESLSRENCWPSAFSDQLGYFLKVIGQERPNLGSPENHYRHMAFIEAAYASRERGVIVNPHDFLNDQEENIGMDYEYDYAL